MAEFKKWISYLYAYNGEEKEKNVGFARVEARDGRCRLTIGVKGACGTNSLDVGLYIRRNGLLQRISVGTMWLREGGGEWVEVTGEDNLLGTGVKLTECGGLWLCCEGQETIYLASWEKRGLDVREFLPQAEEAQEAVAKESDTEVAAQEQDVPKVITPRRVVRKPTMGVQREASRMQAQVVRSAACPQTPPPGSLEEIPPPSLWESLYRYYPKISPELRERGIELLQIRPADIRYLPRRLWYYGSNSFLLHGYYHYKYLVLGRIHQQEGHAYILGVPGVQTDRDRSAADMFGFHHFLPLQGQEGYWITQITL